MKWVPRSRLARAGAGVAVGSPLAGYGTQVYRGGQSAYAERTFDSRDARDYNRAADAWVDAGRSGNKKFRAKYYDQARRQFVADNPKARRIRPTVRRWEDHFSEVQAIRDAKARRPSLADIARHPVASRRSSDRMILERLVAGGTTRPVHRSMLLGKQPGKTFAHRRLSSWTPHEKVANDFGAKHERYHHTGTGRLLANQPKSLPKAARSYVLSANVRSANLAPLSRFGNVDERVSVRRVPRGQRARLAVGKSWQPVVDQLTALPRLV